MNGAHRRGISKYGAAGLAAAMVLIAGGAAAQYKWTDATGRVVYGDNPPREARNIQRIDARGASGDADALAALPFETRRAVQQFPVVLYTTADCAPCDAGRQLLRARGVPYGERLISSKEDSEQLAKLGYGERLPILTVGRQVQKEFETNAWHTTLDGAGYPRAAQLPRGWAPVATPLAPRRAETAADANSATPAAEPKRN
jgi:glutaredoxin